MILIDIDKNNDQFIEILHIWKNHKLYDVSQNFGDWLDVMEIKYERGRPWSYVNKLFFEEKEYLAFRLKYAT